MDANRNAPCFSLIIRQRTMRLVCANFAGNAIIFERRLRLGPWNIVVRAATEMFTVPLIETRTGSRIS